MDFEISGPHVRYDGHSVLILNQNLTSVSFLKVIASFTLNHISIILRSTGLSCILNESFTHAWFCDIIHWSFRKYDALSYADLPNVKTFCYRIFF